MTRPFLEPLEDRDLLSASYSLSADGVLSVINNGQSTQLLTDVKSFAVDNAGDVFALVKTNGILEEMPATANDFLYVLGRNVDAFGVDLVDNQLIGLLASDVYQAAIAGPNANGFNSNYTIIGKSGIQAPDGSIWFLGSPTSDPNGGLSIISLTSGKLTTMPDAATALAVINSTIYALDGLNSVSIWTGFAWSAIPFAYSQRGPYFFGTDDADGKGDHTLFQWQYGQTLLGANGPAGVYLVDGQDGFVYLQDASQQIFGHNPTVTDPSWQSINALTATDGSKFFQGINYVSLDGGLYGSVVGRWANGQVTWGPFGYASALAPGNGAYWALAGGNKVWGWNGSTWVQQTSVTAADNSVWFLGFPATDSAGDHPILYFAFGQVGQVSGQAYYVAAAGGVVQAGDHFGRVQIWRSSPIVPRVTRAADGTLYTLVNGVLWRAANSNSRWLPFSPMAASFELAASGTKIYVLSTNGSVNSAPTGIITSTGGQWTYLGSHGIVTADGIWWFLGTFDSSLNGYRINQIQGGILSQTSAGANFLWLLEGEVFSEVNGQVFAWNGTSFMPQPTAGNYFLGRAKVDGLGNNAIYSYSFNNGIVTKLAGSGVAVAVADFLYVRDASGHVKGYSQGVFTLVGSLTTTAGTFILGLTKDSAGNHAVYQLFNGNVNRGPSAAALFTADGTVWAIDSSHELFTLIGSIWQRVSSATPVADGSTWFLGNTTIDAKGDHDVYRYAAGTATRLPGEAAFILQSSFGEIVSMDGNKNAWSWQNSTSTPMFHVTAGDRSIWYRGNLRNKFGEYTVYRLASGKLQEKSAAARIATVNANIWLLGGAGNVVEWSGSTATTLVSVKAVDDSSWVLGQKPDFLGNYAIYRWPATGQPGQMPGSGTALAVGEGTVWKMDALGQVSRWSGSAWQKSLIGAESVGADGSGKIYAVDRGGKAVRRFSGTTWSVIASVTVIDGNGDLWFLDKTDSGFQRNRPIVRMHNGSVATIGYGIYLGAVNGTITVLNAANQILRRSAQNWDVFTIPTSTYQMWKAKGGPTGFYGLPTGDPLSISGGSFFKFQQDAIFQPSVGAAIRVYETYYVTWLKLHSTPSTDLGAPVSQIQDTDTELTTVQYYQYGCLYLVLGESAAQACIYANPDTSGLGLTQAQAFSGVHVTDVQQELSSTCEFLSSLAAAASQNPTALNSHIKQDDPNNALGTWDITLYINNKWQTYHIIIGKTTGVDPYPGLSGQGMWVVACQRAFLKAFNVTDPTVITPNDPWRSSENTLSALTGNPVTYVSFANTPSFDWSTLYDYLTNPTHMDDVVASCPDKSNNVRTDPTHTLVGSHAYTVIRVIPPSDNDLIGTTVPLVKLRNPWGTNPNGAIQQDGSEPKTQDDGFITLTWQQFTTYFTSISYCWAGLSVVQR